MVYFLGLIMTAEVFPCSMPLNVSRLRSSPKGLEDSAAANLARSGLWVISALMDRESSDSLLIDGYRVALRVDYSTRFEASTILGMACKGNRLLVEKHMINAEHENAGEGDIDEKLLCGAAILKTSGNFSKPSLDDVTVSRGLRSPSDLTGMLSLADSWLCDYEADNGINPLEFAPAQKELDRFDGFGHGFRLPVLNRAMDLVLSRVVI
jgi:hypothetical protein